MTKQSWREALRLAVASLSVLASFAATGAAEESPVEKALAVAATAPELK